MLAAASKVGETTYALLCSLGDSDAVSRELQDILLGLAKAVANASQASFHWLRMEIQYLLILELREWDIVKLAKLKTQLDLIKSHLHLKMSITQ